MLRGQRNRRGVKIQIYARFLYADLKTFNLHLTFPHYSKSLSKPVRQYMNYLVDENLLTDGLLVNPGKLDSISSSLILLYSITAMCA